MVKNIALLFLMLLVLLIAGLFSYSHSATMNDYCQTPPFVSATVEPNVFSVVDVSGSMTYCAYNPNKGKEDCCDKSAGCGWTYRGDEEGYFDPTKVYRYNSTDKRWEETTGTVTECPKYKYGISTSKLYQGSCLNFIYMVRIDLLRWAMTGGKPSTCATSSSCDKSDPPSSCFDVNTCDPELWDQLGNQSSGKVGYVCNNTIGGCILQTSSGEKVKVPWSRVYDGLLFKFKALSVKPRMGALFFSGTSMRSRNVYVGDFTDPNSTSDLFPYRNLITHINATYPTGYTPTGPAMWDTFNYYKQVSPKYGGLSPQSGTGDYWKNPMYACAQGGTNCKYVPCAKNFVILLSDGQWNKGGYPVGDACTIDKGYEDNSADPVVPAYKMHMGFTNVKTNIKPVWALFTV